MEKIQKYKKIHDVIFQSADKSAINMAERSLTLVFFNGII